MIWLLMQTNIPDRKMQEAGGEKSSNILLKSAIVLILFKGEWGVEIVNWNIIGIGKKEKKTQDFQVL